MRLAGAPVRAVEQIRDWLQAQAAAAGRDGHRRSSEREAAEYRSALTHETERRRKTAAPTGGEAGAFARSTNPSDPPSPALRGFDTVVSNLGWACDTDKIVFGHTHQPLDGVTAPGGSIRYWNSGSWIYEPDLSSREAYVSYLKNAWPGTAVLIDSDEPQPRLLKIREHLNPLHHIDGGSAQ